MIYLPCKYELISVLSYAEGIYHPSKMDLIPKGFNPFRKKRISLKKTFAICKCFFLAPPAGIDSRTAVLGHSWL